MKPVVTWITVANARTARILENRGPGKGVHEVIGKSWHAKEPRAPKDDRVVGHSIAGPVINAVESGDPQDEADKQFAKEVSETLLRAYEKNQFDRIVLVSAPHMLGLLRPCLDARLKDVLIDEIDKDLTAQSADAVQDSLNNIMAT